MSEALYEEFLQPLLLVGLFERPEHLSAATMIETLYFYSAPHRICCVAFRWRSQEQL